MKNKLTAAAVLCMLLALSLASGEAAEAARSSLALCAGTIVPALFPFFVLSGLLGRLALPQRLGQALAPLAGRCFGVSGAGLTALPVGLLGGYPLGAACVADLLSRREIDAEEAERLLLFCNNSGPAFFLGAVGAGVFHSRVAGFLLYASHVAAALAAGLLLRRPARAAGARAAAIRPEPLSAAFPAAVRQAVRAVLHICGFAVCFSVLLRLLERGGLSALPWLQEASGRALFYGFFELGSAVGAMRGLPLTPQSLTLAAAVLGWGGLSVHCQTAALFAEQELSLRRHTLGRACSAAFSAAFAWIFGRLLL